MLVQLRAWIEKSGLIVFVELEHGNLKGKLCRSSNWALTLTTKVAQAETTSSSPRREQELQRQACLHLAAPPIRLTPITDSATTAIRCPSTDIRALRLSSGRAGIVIVRLKKEVSVNWVPARGCAAQHGLREPSRQGRPVRPSARLSCGMVALSNAVPAEIYIGGR